MNSTFPILCMKCKQKVVAHWSGNHGQRFLFEKDGKQYYHAKCPQCGNKWDVQKKESGRTHTKDGRLASWKNQKK